VDLQRLWSNYDLAIGYVGGVGYYNVAGLGFKQVQQADVDQRITWKRGQVGLRDSFSYLPQGNFAGAYGTFNPEGQTGGGAITSQNVFLGGSLLGSLGTVSRIINLSTLDVVENLTPKSSVTATGGYSLLHYMGNGPGGNTLTGPNGETIGFLGTTEISGQVGYDRILTPHDQAAIVYGYQDFSFAVTGLSFQTYLIQLMWGHRISGRMDFLIGAGPQFVLVNQECTAIGLFTNPNDCQLQPDGSVTGSIPETRITGSGQAMLRYRFSKTMLSLAYQRYVTGGSGFFAGARSDVGRVGVSRPLGRVWSAFSDVGYAHNVREQLASEGVNANSYQYGFAGFGLHRRLGRNFRVYGSYEFNYLSFDNSLCENSVGGSTCSRISQRHIGTIGLDWTPRPIRID